MDAYDLIKWRETYFGLDRTTAARRMGIAINSLRAYEEGKRRIPPYIPLVCAAIAKNLPPWELPPHLRREKKGTPIIAPTVAPVGRPPNPNKERKARTPKGVPPKPKPRTSGRAA